MKVNFEEICTLWRASLAYADHIDGIGKTPEEALGRLCFNHPERVNIGNFNWITQPTKPYPSGIQQESFIGD